MINKYVEKQEQRPSEESSSSSSEDEEEEKDNGNKSEEDDEVVVEMTLMEDEETTTMETDLPLAWREPKPEPKEDEVEKQVGLVFILNGWLNASSGVTTFSTKPSLWSFIEVIFKSQSCVVILYLQGSMYPIARRPGASNSVSQASKCKSGK